MEQNSWRHHYLPEFFIKEFTDDNGLVYVYNKIEKRILKNPRPPSSVFFEKGLNTIDGVDTIEKLSKFWDNKTAQIIRKICQTNGEYPLVGNQKTDLWLFINFLMWRNPANVYRIESIFKNHNFDDLGFNIFNRDTGMPASGDDLKLFKEDLLFRRSMSLTLNLLPFIKLSEKEIQKTFDRSKIFYHPNHPAIMGDWPMIFRKPMDSVQFGEFPELILPLGSYLTFIHSYESNLTAITKGFLILRDLAMFNAASKYVICKDRNYLEKTIELQATLCDKYNISSTDQFPINEYLYEELMK